MPVSITIFCTKGNETVSRKLFQRLGFALVNGRQLGSCRRRKSVVVRRSQQLVPAVAEHYPLLRVGRAARAVGHEALAGRPAGLAARRRLGERPGRLPQQLAPSQADERLERAPEVAVDHDADDRVHQPAGEGEEHDGEVDRVAVMSSGRHGDDGGDSVRGPATVTTSAASTTISYTAAVAPADDA